MLLDTGIGCILVHGRLLLLLLLLLLMCQDKVLHLLGHELKFLQVLEHLH